MPPSSFRPFHDLPVECAAVGRMLTGYTNLEVGLFHCVEVALSNFDTVFKKMFGQRSETRRIDTAASMGGPAYALLGLDADFAAAVEAMRHCLTIRNQYAHWVFWNDNSGELAFANLEDLAVLTTPVNDLMALGVFHVNAALVEEQEAFFDYVDRYLLWVNYEGRYRAGRMKALFPNKPTPLPVPPLYVMASRL
jgi:hypothetical protein